MSGAKLPTEWLVAQDAGEVIWLRFRRLASVNICRRILNKRYPEMPASTADRKAAGVASAMRSALGYWETQPTALNAKILSRYYAALQVSVAEEVASSREDSDLERVQRQTEKGHGLALLPENGEKFPNECYVVCMKSGNFCAYCESKGIPVSRIAFDKRPRQLSDIAEPDRAKAVPLVDLFRRVPELQPILRESLDVAPLSFQAVHSMRNATAGIFRQSSQGVLGARGSAPPLAPAPAASKTSYIRILSSDEGVDAQYLQRLGLPVKNIQEKVDEGTKSPAFEGEIQHPADQPVWNHFQHYKSAYCGTSVIAPLWGYPVDVFSMHLMILYACSIVVRYMPSLWHRIEDGDLNHVRALLEHYMSIVDGVLPVLAVQNVTGVRLAVVEPGSWNAPV